MRPPMNRLPRAASGDPYISRAVLSLTMATSGWGTVAGGRGSTADSTAAGGRGSTVDSTAAGGRGPAVDSTVAGGRGRAAGSSAGCAAEPGAAPAPRRPSVSAKARPASSGVPMASK